MHNKYEVKRVCKFVKETEILKDVSLSFEEGLNVIVGQSGAGKSTLLNILGLIDDCTSGDLMYNNIDLINYNEEEREKFRSHYIGFIFQSNNLISDMSVRENIDLAMDISNVSPEEYVEILERFDINTLIDKKVNVLSGGEQQRVSIVRALLKKTKIILADEPTGNLDSKNTELVFEILQECAKKYNKIVIVVTHNEEMAQKYANVLIRISDGVVVEVNKKYGVEIDKLESEPFEETWLDSKISLYNKFKFIRNFIKRKFTKMLTTAFIAAITIAISAVVIDINNQANQMFADMNTGYLETDLVQIYPNKMEISNTSEYGGTFRENEILEIRNSGLFSTVTEFVEMNLRGRSSDAECDIIGVRYIEISEFYRDRIMKNDIEGEFPQNEYEVILGKDVCQYLFGDKEVIGKQIALTNGRGTAVVTVVGVNNTKNVEGIYLSYVCNLITFEIADQDISDYACVDIKSDVDKSGIIYTGGYVGGYGVNVSYPLIEGRYPQNEDEIAIDVLIYNEYLKTHSDTNLFSEEVYFNIGNVRDVKICGVYDSNRQQMFCIKEECVEDMQKQFATSLYCYALNDDVISNFHSIEIDRKYNCAVLFEHLRATISEKNRSVTNILLVIALVLSVVTFIVIGSFVRMSIKERVYEIGVIRALGGSKKDITSIFRLEGVVVGGVSAFIAMLLYIMGKNLLIQTILEDITYINDWLMIIAICVSSILFIVVASIIPLREINKVHPIECIRCR